MNLALALGGGAARGAFHLGVLHYCEVNNIEIHAFSGSSIGSIISCSHASGVSAKEQLKIFTSKEIRKAIKFNYFKNGLLKIDTSNKIIKELLPISKIENIPKPVFVNAYDLKKRKLHYFNSGDTITLCIASSAIIPLFRPIKYKNMYLIDGGLFDNIPIKPLENKNYDILSIDLFPKEYANKILRINPIKILKRKIFTQLYENNKYSIENTDYYLASSQIRNFALYSFEEIEDCFNLGVKEAKNHFLDII
ncbi:patatin-like phospholipase family protein [Poseidonibacter antarcticus]|uniref:patatin-like phospholipase family protein n=1 Tax=Poseidonibacter antarcticus TaxID=2478538 RepID=UPI000EF502E1|nr:patatin-like phospholipase family protein [Poseidonibacter antarcticus]